MARNKQPRPDRRGRDKRTGRPAPGIWLYGRHPVMAALANPARQVHRLLTTDAASLADTDRAFDVVGRDQMADLLPPDAVHQGLAALVAPLPAGDLQTVCAPPQDGCGLVLVLDRVSDPRNVGAILRSAAAFSANAVVVPDRHAPLESGVLAKAASGALEIVPTVRVANLSRALDQLADLGYWRFGFAPRHGAEIAKAGMSGHVALVLGAEGQGMRRLTSEHCDALVHLQISPNAESLNVSATAAIALFETRRQIGWPAPASSNCDGFET